MAGIANGIDRDASRALVCSKRVSAFDQGILRNILSGGIWIRDRAFRANMEDSNICKFCRTGEVEDHAHLWWHCPAWSCIRERFRNVWFHFKDAWPACFKLCGIMPSCHSGFDHLGMDADSAASSQEGEAESGEQEEVTADGSREAAD